MANKDIFGIDEKKKKKEEGKKEPFLKPIKFRIDPFNIMPGDLERTVRQVNVERYSVQPPDEMDNNRVAAPEEKLKKKEEE